MWPEPAAAAGSMSAGPLLQLAVLWPWLLMATLHAGLGHTRLALAAAVESERSASQKAIIRVIPLKVEPIVLEGEFANVAEVTPAEGKLLQVRAAVFNPAPSAPLSCSGPLSLFLFLLFQLLAQGVWFYFPTAARRHFSHELSTCVCCPFVFLPLQPCLLLRGGRDDADGCFLVWSRSVGALVSVLNFGSGRLIPHRLLHILLDVLMLNMSRHRSDTEHLTENRIF